MMFPRGVCAGTDTELPHVLVFAHFQGATHHKRCNNEHDIGNRNKKFHDFFKMKQFHFERAKSIPVWRPDPGVN